MSDAINLLEETKKALLEFDYKESDIMWIGNRDGYCCDWARFCELADRDYDSGFGGQEVAPDLIIVFTDDRIMYRAEYDGSEWWEMQVAFVMPSPAMRIESLFTTHSHDTLSEINKKDLPVINELKCDDCPCTDESVKQTTCPYADEIRGEEIPVVLCDECYHQRCMDI